MHFISSILLSSIRLPFTATTWSPMSNNSNISGPLQQSKSAIMFVFGLNLIPDDTSHCIGVKLGSALFFMAILKTYIQKIISFRISVVKHTGPCLRPVTRLYRFDDPSLSIRYTFQTSSDDGLGGHGP